MHPEVVQDNPGRCPKCGMALVLKDPSFAPVKMAEDKGLGVLTWKSYLPLIVIILLIIIVSTVVSLNQFSVFNFISYFMIGFFLVFAGFKLIDLKGFAQGYYTYDLFAQRFFPYGYVYPFIELGFGLLMLYGIITPLLLWIEVIVMTFSGIGVAIKLAKHEKFQCVCLGTVLKVPLSTITLIEDFGMAILALILIFR